MKFYRGMIFVVASSLFAVWFAPCASAGIFDDMKDTLDKMGQPAQAAQITSVNAVDMGLPANWQAYFLDEPEFKGKVFIATTGPANAPVVFLIHGLGQNGLRDWLQVAPALDKKYRVIMVDLPGFAASGQPSAKLSPTRYANLLHFIKPYFSDSPVAVVGHSMGGAVAFRYAYAYPADVKHLVLVDAAGILQRTAFVKQSAVDRLPIERLSGLDPLLDYALGLQNVGTQMLEKLLNVSDPTVWLGSSDLTWGLALKRLPNVNAALGLMEEDFSKALFELRQPVSIVWGEKDLIAPVRTSQVLAGNLPQVSLTKIAEAAHMPMVSHTEQFNRWLLNALDQVTPAYRAPEAPSSGEENYTCNGETGKQVTGTFNQINISDCKGVFLQQVRANKISIKNSVVQMLNVVTQDTSTSLSVAESTLVATSSRFAGNIALDFSRLDFAGVTLTGEKPFSVTRQSRLVLSVSRTQFGGHTRYLHQDVLLENSNF